MKIKDYFQKTLSKKYASLMVLTIIFFLVGAISLWLSLHYFKEGYSDQIDLLERKKDLAQEINNSFNNAFSEARGYFAYGNVTLKEHALATDEHVSSLFVQFKEIISTSEDKRFIKEAEQFQDYYFGNALPSAISFYEDGHPEEVAKLANSTTTANITNFQRNSANYISDLGKKLEASFERLIKHQTYVQVGFIGFILIILLTLLRITRILLNQQDELKSKSIQNEELYKKSEAERSLNQDILNTIQEGILLINNEGVIVQVNKQLIDMFQWSNKIGTIIGLDLNNWTSVMAAQVEDPESFQSFLRKATEKKESDSIFIYKKLNPNQVIKVYCTGLYHVDDKVGTILVHRDITKEFEVDMMKSEFVSTVSHELRTPLASILGFTELLLNRELKPDRQQKYFTTIYNEAKRLTALINDFLDIQRMEAGKQSYEKKFINLKLILDKVVESQSIHTNEHQISIIDESNKAHILGDRDKIEQVFTNLINNSIKYSPNGGDIEIKLYHYEDRVFVDIKDQGLGIPEGSMQKLFSRFYRIDNSDRRRIGGTGLGLAIVQEIMKAHNGEVFVQSQYGSGSIFTCSFPHIPGQLEELAPVTESRALGFKVMVVEDDQSLGQLITEELKEDDFQVSYFKRGKDALAVIREELPDAIVLDILLEEDELDGWSIMEEIKKQEILKNIPIFISSALDEKEKGFSLGATDYLIKPYKPSQLSKAIMQTLLKTGKVGQVYIPQDELGEE
ncbi:ATP-binding protein [Pseudoneobacillus rhizosphaerae]|uniref:histidine kinase n=1 Tax=Pseudoneobacillus rhizosphaerae TaxID=2880968 RepID=A0A9C7LB54_9BACI|nr:ATP-binding protein [Pseudoneobacillus rhizosphaerae]CAG9609796.1 Sensor histidine kinase RcsC [Pseudoneobacillus rhizosphaerae]